MCIIELLHEAGVIAFGMRKMNMDLSHVFTSFTNPNGSADLGPLRKCPGRFCGNRELSEGFFERKTGSCKICRELGRSRFSGDPQKLSPRYTDGTVIRTTDIIDGKRLCFHREHLEFIDSNLFNADNSKENSERGWCADCQSANRRYTSHEISREEYAALLEYQGNRCANPGCLCPTPYGWGWIGNTQARKSFNIDHDHQEEEDKKKGWFLIGGTGERRGLLCQRCNFGAPSGIRASLIMLGLDVYLKNPPLRHIRGEMTLVSATEETELRNIQIILLNRRARLAAGGLDVGEHYESPYFMSWAEELIPDLPPEYAEFYRRAEVSN